jgi:excisionase family DNA binding protein
MVQSEALTLRETREILSCSRTTIYKLAAEGSLRTIRLGRAIRVPRSAIEELLAGQGKVDR